MPTSCDLLSLLSHSVICVSYRSKVVSRLADTSVSTTSFGRQQLASFSDHYLSDFVLHGTSEDNIIKKVSQPQHYSDKQLKSGCVYTYCYGVRYREI